MKVFVNLFFTLIIICSVGCSNNEKSSNNESEKISQPKLDLHAAIYMRDLEAVRQHIKYGTDVNVLEPSRKSTPLITAAALGEPDAAKILIEAGADINRKNLDGSTPLHIAAFFCEVDLVKYLLENGADRGLTNNDGKTALQIVEPTFEKVEAIYDAVGEGIKPLGIEFDYDQIKVDRPIIAKMLK